MLNKREKVEAKSEKIAKKWAIFELSRDLAKRVFCHNSRCRKSLLEKRQNLLYNG